MAARQAMIDEIQRIKDLSEKRVNELQLDKKKRKLSSKTPTRNVKRIAPIVPSSPNDVFGEDEEDEFFDALDIPFNRSRSASAVDINFCTVTKKQTDEFVKSMNLKKVFKTRPGKSTCVSMVEQIFPSFVNRLTRTLGAGEFGTVFASRGPNSEKTAVKVMRDTVDEDGTPINTLKDVGKEMEMGFKFNALGLAPEILDMETKVFNVGNNKKETIHFMSMGRVDGTVQSYLSEPRSDQELESIFSKVFDVVLELKNENLNHGDLHIGNVGFIIGDDGEMEIQLIDYGFSMDGQFVELDVLQLIRVTHFRNLVHFSNRDRADKIIRRFSKDLFGLVYPEYQTVGVNKEDGPTISKLELIQDAIRDKIFK